MQLSRIYGLVGEEYTIELFNQRAKLPTIIIQESAPLTEEPAAFCKLSRLSISGTALKFWLTPMSTETAFPASLLEQNKHVHQLSDAWNWHHTCWQLGTGNIFETLFHAKNVQVQYNQPKVFTLTRPTETIANQVACMMPFAKNFDDVYSAIREGCTEVGMTTLRVDELYGTTSIIGDVVAAIDKANIVICDLTGRNPNVLYETGISHALGRDVIIIAQTINDDVPFDLRHLRCIEYDGLNQAGRDELKNKIARTIEAINSTK